MITVELNSELLIGDHEQASKAWDAHRPAGPIILLLIGRVYVL